MSLPCIISPSILGSDFSRLGEECRDVLGCGADWLHCDIMDGHFVPNISFGTPVLERIRAALPDAVLDVHVMVTDPLMWAPSFAKLRAHMYTFHIEAVTDAPATCRAIRELGMRVGVALKPKTPVEAAFEVCDQAAVDMVLVMTVEPGFGGQSFMRETLAKVEILRRRYPKLHLQVDGGINLTNAAEAGAAGANVIVAGTSIFNKVGEERTRMVRDMKSTVDGALSPWRTKRPSL